MARAVAGPAGNSNVGSSSRADSPAPKSVSAKPAEVAVKQASKAEAEPEPEILGVHPQVFYAVVVAPITIFIVFALAAGPGREHVVGFIELVIKQWNQVRDPVQKILVDRGDLVMILATMTTFAPLMYVGLVMLCRVLNDLEHLSTLQKVLLITLVFGSLISTILTTKDRVWTPKGVFDTWESLTKPMEAVLTEHADRVIAGSSILAFLPLLYCLFASTLRAIWNCRIKLVVENEDEAAESAKDK